MRLYIVQHGDALLKEVDPDRPLSERGRADIHVLVDWLRSRGVTVAGIRHSGKTRARETAELLQPLLVRDGQIAVGEGLLPNDSPITLLEELGEASEDVLIASHLPLVSRLVSLAVTGSPDGEPVAFKPGSVAGIERNDAGAWRLFLFLQP